ncbi:protein kinase domain-containing protein [Paludibaculum fermentans]|uniref:serine/threonine-protein kinase n=1 Tax=Paludibaculum fermentans TaxID=1473598 RepID=UPI003EBDEAF4
MTPNRWQRLEALFEAALELEPDRRPAFLQRECAGDLEMLGEVQRMLAADSDDGHDLRRVVDAEALRAVAEAEEEPADGRRIGPWLITGVLGRGGMGSVFRAMRADDQYRKQVAIKVLRHGLESDFALARIRYERQILSNLEHPNIARMIDGGESGGLPYIVLEFVEGETLTTYCEKRGQTVPQRLELFQQVCEAVEYAHQHLVVHRDLKPSNILVTPEGRVKLLDFGIAKLEDPDWRPEAAAETATGMRMMTPEYASPEQVRGEPVSAATDVYSLGAVLFELLTGAKAQSITTTDPLAVARIVCQREVPRPSTAALPAHRRALQGDLDNIILKAMQKEPARRFASVEQFSADIRRHLAGLPVRARPDTPAYRLSKFLRRNAWGVAAGLAVTLSLAGGTAASLHQARRAERRFEQVRSLANSFLFEFHDKIANLPGSTEARQLVVAKALTYLSSLAAESGGDRSLRLELASAYLKVGDVQGDPSASNLGQREAAMVSYGRALEIARELVRERRDTEALRALAWAHVKTGSGRRSDNLPEAISLLRAAVQYSEELRNIAGKPDDELMLESHRVLGDAYTQQLDWQAARTEFRASLESAERLAALNRAGEWNDRAEEAVVRCQQRVSKAEAMRGDLEGAMKGFRRAVELGREMLQKHPNRASIQRNLIINYMECGRFLGNPRVPNLGRPEEAMVYYEQAGQFARSMRAYDPKDEFALRSEIAYLLSTGDTLGPIDPVRSLARLRQALAANAGSRDKLSQQSFDLQIGMSMVLAFERLGQYRAALEMQDQVSAKRLAAEATAKSHEDFEENKVEDALRRAHVLYSARQFEAACRMAEGQVQQAAAFGTRFSNDLSLVWMHADAVLLLARCQYQLAKLAGGSPTRSAALRASAQAAARQCRAIWDTWLSRHPGNVFVDRNRQLAVAFEQELASPQ